MSPRTFTSVVALWGGLCTAAAAFVISVFVLASPSRRSPAVVWSARISGAYFLPSLAFLTYAILSR
jgi:hypothetical protein